ncbi:MAG: PQQ-binding-like beta-propeller repeat protein [Anaerolineales bacterium]|nr:PQQ-binding-like beta-propeller repeat protein [Anaerolineales bacterium]
MTLSIFCPNNHLILDALRCKECNWERPLPGDIGEPVWAPVALGAGLGGPGRGVFANPGVAGGIAVFPSREGQFFGVDLSSGQVCWNIHLDPGLMTRSLVPFDNKLLASLSDERQLGQAENANLLIIDPDSSAQRILWASEGHQLSPPVLTDELILLRTSTSELVALSRNARPQPVWRRPLQAWWALPPFIAGGMILVSDGRPMHGEGYLKAFDLADGTPRWKIPTDGLVSRPLSAGGGVVVFINGRRRLVALDLQTGETLWEQEYKRVYSPPLIGAGNTHLVVRGAAPSGEAGHYMLQALDPVTGEMKMEVPLPVGARARVLACHENTLFLGCDAGCIHAYRATDGEQQWVYQLGSDEDPIRTELVIADGFLLAGTHSGKVIGIRVAAPCLELEPPGEYIERGEFDNAAAAYALIGDMRRAAEIFAQELKDHQKALRLYDNAGLYQEAGELASQLEMHKEAKGYFAKAGNPRAVAEELIRNGDLLGAAKVLEQCGELMRAAKLYEEAGDLRSSLEVYKRLKNWPKAFQLWTQVSPEDKDVHDFGKAGKYKEAGEAAFALGMFDKAAKNFEKAGLQERELVALQNLAKEKGKHWALERIAEVSRSKGKFAVEADAWSKLGRPAKAANAYHRAAQQAERIDPGNEVGIADLYERARHYYDDIGMEIECRECREKIVYYRSLPFIAIKGETQKAFREGEFNLMDLVLRNVGRGVASNVRVQVSGGHFEIGETASSSLFRNIYPERERKTKIPLRPLVDQVGETVPLIIEWTWQDIEGNNYREQITEYFQVKAKDESQSGGTPQHIEYHFHDQAVHAAGERVDVIKGDRIEGDQIKGDKVEAGAQKGDRVEIRRGEGVRLSGEGLGQVDTAGKDTLLCPNCHLPPENPEDTFCWACGGKLPRSCKRR